jgi:hypothetical protein
MMASLLKTHKEKVTPTMTKRQATRGKVVSLHKYWKGISISSFAQGSLDRRHYLNMMLDSTATQVEDKQRGRGRDSDGGEE